MNRISLAAIAFVSALLLPSPALTGTVTVAVVAAQSGDAAPSNRVLFEAVRFAAEEINAAGGLLGSRIDLLEIDNGSTAIGSHQAALRAIEAQVAAVIGASWSEHSLAMAAPLQAAKIPMITPISTHPEVTRVGDFIFRVCYTDPAQGAAMAAYARDVLGARTAVMLVNVSRKYSTDLASVFAESFVAKGGEIVWQGNFLLDASDFEALLTQAKRLAPDILFIPGDYRDSSFLISQARAMGIATTIVGGDGLSIRLYDYIGDLAEGIYYTNHWHRESPRPESRRFVERYEARHGTIRQNTIPLSYDALMLWADAVRRAGTFDPEKVRAALAATRDFPGVTGPIRFDEVGDPRKPVVINRLENGGATHLLDVDPQ